MYFELTEEQLALREMVVDLLADLAPLSRLRELWAAADGSATLRDGGGAEAGAGDDTVPGQSPWTALAEAGLLGLGTPEDMGGSGGSEVEAAVVLEAAGRACLPAPIIDVLGVAAPVLAATPELADLRTAMIAGTARIGVAVDSPLRVAGAPDLAAAIVVDGDDVLVVPREGLSLSALATCDAPRGLATIEDIDVTAATAVAMSVEEVRTRWIAGNAMALVGTGQRMLDMAVQHASVRTQFGAPIGSYQAVAHPLATVHVDLEAARAACWHAALALRDDPAAAHTAARVAAVASHDVAKKADLVSLQVHAGIGFTWEHDLHMVLKHAVALRSNLGDPVAHRAAVLDALVPAN